VIKAKPFQYYHENQVLFLRIYFTKIKNRQNAIMKMRTLQYETTTDDYSNYYRVICRDFMTTFSKHAVIQNYKLLTDTKFKGHVFSLSIKDILKYNDILPNMSLVMCWDIETYSPTGDLPLAENTDDVMFCLSMTFHTAGKVEPLVKYCLCEFPAAPSTDYITVVCGNETNIIRAFGQIFNKMFPEYVFGFNDSDYDWKFLVTRASQTPGLLCELATLMDISTPFYPYTDENILKFNYRRETIKLDATTDISGAALALPGYLAVDVRTLFRKLYPTAEYSSLKWFLDKHKLAAKEDMPITQLFDTYRRYSEFNATEHLSEQHDTTRQKLMTEMALVNQYCVTDAARCQELLIIKNCIADATEMSDISYVSVYDAFFRANGMKVINLTIAIGQRAPFYIRFSNKQNTDCEDGKYPGAHVIPPEKGPRVSKLSIDERIAASDRSAYAEWANVTQEQAAEFKEFVATHGACLTPAELDQADPNKLLPWVFRRFLLDTTDRPIFGLDFASLYPSLIRTYNLSPEYCIRDVKQAATLNANGVKLVPVKFEYNSKMRTAYFVSHNNCYDPADPNFKFGVFPYILNELFALRDKYKREYKALVKSIEHLELQRSKLERGSTEYAGLTEQIETLQVKCNYYDAKQKAVKVFMNTFYGVAGKKESSFFELTVAGGVTSWGKRSLQFANSHAVALRCHVYYGDTDSLYISVDPVLFVEVDRLYYSGKISKLDYWTQLVKITFVAAIDIRDKINAAFVADNGTKFLSMAFEEVLWPVIFLAKKKYYGVPHVDEINFFPDKLFIRGLEVIKRGQAQILRTIFSEMMKLTMHPDNTLTVMEIVFANIDKIYSRHWDPRDFVQSRVYKPNKKNVAVHTFVRRMAEQNIIIAPNERFEFVLVKRNPYTYDLRGRRSEISIGDKMELASTKHEVDLEYYMTGSIIGQMARLITYDPQFYTESLSDSPADMKKAEDTIYANAVKHVTSYASRYFAKYNTFGKVYQNLYKCVNSVVKTSLKCRDAITGELLTANVNYEDFETWIISTAEAECDALIDSNYGRSIVRGHLGLLDVSDLTSDEQTCAVNGELIKMSRAWYGSKNTIIEDREKQYNQRIEILRKEIRGTYDTLMKLYARTNGTMKFLIENLKKDLNSQIAPLEEATNAPREYNMGDFPEFATKLTDQVYLSELSRVAEVQVDELYTNPITSDAIKKLKYLYLNIKSAMICIKQSRCVVAYLRHKAAAAIGFVPVDVAKVAEAKAACIAATTEILSRLTF
jgi:DNA polymerase elongation subunit (family B)